MIVLLFYIGRTRIKEIDKVVYGYEFPNDSIFALIIRVPSYAGAFLWKWSAKKVVLKEKSNTLITAFAGHSLLLYLIEKGMFDNVIGCS